MSKLQDSIDSLWQVVDNEYVTSHLEAAKWSNRSIAASKRYSSESRKRASAILAYVNRQCKKHGISHHVDSVHMIDHSQNPPQVAPYIVVSMWCNEEPRYKAEIKFCKIKQEAVLVEQLSRAIESLLTIRRGASNA